MKAANYCYEDLCECDNAVDLEIRGRVVLDANQVLVAGLSVPGKSAYRELVDLYSRAVERASTKADIRAHMQDLLTQCRPEDLARYRAAVDECIKALNRANVTMSLILGVTATWL